MTIDTPQNDPILWNDNPGFNSYEDDLSCAIEWDTFEISIFKWELCHCLNRLVAYNPHIRKFRDTTLYKKFRWAYKWRKKRWNYKLKPEDAKKIMKIIIAEFNKKRDEMDEYERDEYCERVKMDLEYDKNWWFDKDWYEINRLKKNLSYEDLEDILDRDDVLEGMKIMSDLENYVLTLRLAITLAELWVFNPEKDKMVNDIPNFEWLSEDDKIFLCDISQMIKEARMSWKSFLELQIELEKHFNLYEEDEE